MAKKLSKKKIQKKTSTTGSILESANQIWLAGLGAFAKAQKEGGKIFETLVAEGEKVEHKTRTETDSKVDDVRSSVSSTVENVQKSATESWDKLETIFEDRVARALGRIGVPTSEDIKQLSKRVEALHDEVDALQKAQTRAAPAKTTGTAAKTTKKKVAKKTPAKKTS